MAEISEVTARLLDYVSYDTQPEDDRESIPGTKKQFELTYKLVGEPKEPGASQVRMSERRCVYACILPNLEEGKTSLALGSIAHMDTAPSFSGKDVKSQFIRDYDRQDICLNREQDVWVRTADFPDLREYEGRILTTTDGTTLLGADDKAGITEIMTMAACLLRYPEVKHRAICIGFTSDEEVGRGVDGFDVEGSGVGVAHTVDGGAPGELEYENFNAASGRVTIHGANIHLGTAKGRIRNALLMAMELQSLLPADKNPMYTEGYEGFYYLDRMTDCMEEAGMDYIIRDHDRVRFEHKKELSAQAAGFLNRKYGSGVAEAVVEDSCYSMKEKIEPHMDPTDKAGASMEKLGIRPIAVPIRGGTDGVRLSHMGLSYPSLCTGGHNFHGKYEFIPVQSMEKITGPPIEIARSFAKTIADDAADPCLPDAPAL